ncbi:hypothetical protein JTE90_012424, partial [Oedothorax gibbosus]
MQRVYNSVYQNLENVAAKQSRLRDKIAKIKTFEIGQKVYLYTPATKQSTGRAFAKKISGPFRIVKKHSDLNYTIQESDKPFSKSTKVHVDRLFDYTERRPDLQIPAQSNTGNFNNATGLGTSYSHYNDTNQFSWYDDAEGTDILMVTHTNTEVHNRIEKGQTLSQPTTQLDHATIPKQTKVEKKREFNASVVAQLILVALMSGISVASKAHICRQAENSSYSCEMVSSEVLESYNLDLPDNACAATSCKDCVVANASFIITEKDELMHPTTFLDRPTDRLGNKTV